MIESRVIAGKNVFSRIMGLTGLIVLEGANATGKSSLAAELQRRFDAVIMHQTYRFKDQIFDYHTAVLRRALKLSKTRLVVLDRLWMSEEVYAYVYRSGTPWPHQGRFVERVLRKASAVTIVCVDPSDDELKNRYLKTRSGRTDADVENNLRVNRRFRALLQSSSPMIRQTYLDDLIARKTLSAELLFFSIGIPYDEIIDMTKAALQLLQCGQYRDAIDDDNFLGSLYSADFLFVGDRPNAKHRWTWPFYEYANCSLWLTDQLHQLNFDESTAVWTNACHTQHTLQQLKGQGSFNRLKVISLGQQAKRELDKLKIPVAAEIPHPQYGRRFEHDGENYRRQLSASLAL